MNFFDQNSDSNNQDDRGDRDNRENRENREGRNSDEKKNNRKNLDNDLKLPIFLFLSGLDKLEGGDLGEDYSFGEDEDIKDNTGKKNICSGMYCDHDELSENIRAFPPNFINKNQNNINIGDLIELGKCYHCKKQTMFRTISLEKLSKLVKPLEKLNNMIGMNAIKKDFVEQIVTSIQNFEKNENELLHTILEGPPGVGKTHVVEILAEIYIAMGYMKKNVIKKVKRSDLIGKYLGHTADKTQKAIDEARGGILLIDEAYSLGNKQKRDSFSKECIDTINQNLTEQADKFICIVIGYEKELNECFFSHNPGLRGRFRHKYTIDGYDGIELEQIFDLKVRNAGWDISPKVNIKEKTNFFIKNISLFKCFGRSIELLFAHTKIAHANRVFWEENPDKKMITMNDIKNGLKRFLTHNPLTDSGDTPPGGMYS